MSAKRVSIGQALMIVALAAVSMGLVRAAPWEVAVYPSLWVLLGAVDFVAVWKLILGRPLRAFHYTFLIVFIIAFFVMANLVATERFRPLGLLVRGYQLLGGRTVGVSPGLLVIGEFWTACLPAAALGCATGALAAWLERRRGWDVAAFVRGALLGFAVANLLVLLDGAARGWALTPARLTGHRILLLACLIAGGPLGLSRLKSRPSDRGGHGV